MKNAFTKLVAVAMFCSVGATLSCGTETKVEAVGEEQPQLSADVQALVELVDEQAFAGVPPSEACKKINAQMAKHGRAMARTKQFKAMIRTQAYKDLARDVVELKKKGCSMSPGGSGGNGGDEGGGINFECLKLQIQAYQHQQALMGTSEYKALEKTRAFKRLSADMQEAQKKGCIKMVLGDLEAA